MFQTLPWPFFPTEDAMNSDLSQQARKLPLPSIQQVRNGCRSLQVLGQVPAILLPTLVVRERQVGVGTRAQLRHTNAWWGGGVVDAFVD